MDEAAATQIHVIVQIPSGGDIKALENIHQKLKHETTTISGPRPSAQGMRERGANFIVYAHEYIAMKIELAVEQAGGRTSRMGDEEYISFVDATCKRYMSKISPIHMEEQEDDHQFAVNVQVGEMSAAQIEELQAGMEAAAEVSGYTLVGTKLTPTKLTPTKLSHELKKGIAKTRAKAVVAAFDDLFTQCDDHLREGVADNDMVYLVVDVKCGTDIYQLERLCRVLAEVSEGKSDFKYNPPAMHLKNTGFIMGMPSRSAILVEHDVSLTDGARTGRMTEDQRGRILDSA
ncbi:hypothetical protein B484DRAFT_399516 [Ochromonadaceae sp. CCMP2298]|nr:hypothetical protein B484DRAFT_399516 [Ochromonadaceae sp. CCMP2298]